MIHSSLFNYGFIAAAGVDVGLKRSSNEDEFISCPEQGFYAVSDGMGGLVSGGETSQMIKRVLPMSIQQIARQLKGDFSPEEVARLLSDQVCMISNSIYDTGNKGHRTGFGATVSGVWLVGDKAIFISLGDSRGYLLPRFKKNIRQITTDHNVAALLVERGEITKEEARDHPSSSSLTRFVGMHAPAIPEVFIREVKPGDRILLCSDGLHGTVHDSVLPRLMRSSKSPGRICQKLIAQANANGGRDNIAAVYIKINR